MGESPNAGRGAMRDGSGASVFSAVGVVIALIATLLSVNAIWGLTSPEDTTLSAWLRGFAPLSVWIFAGLAVSAGVAAVGRIRGRRDLMALGLMLDVYLVGVWISRWIYEWVQPRGGIPFERQVDIFPALWERSFMLWPALPMLVVYAYLLRDRYPETFAFGRWVKPSSRDGDRTLSRWRWVVGLGLYVLVVIAPATWSMQATVDFEPIRSGTLFVFLGPVVIMCLFNGFTEELLFRGLFQPALCGVMGRGTGIVVTGLFFGFHHWGASPDLIAGLPTAIAASLLGMLWGYSVVATRGMGWAICAHALADFAFFSANFV